MNSSAPAPSHDSNGANGETSIDDLFALSDEQILEIDPEPQDIQIADGLPNTSEFDELANQALASGQSSSRSAHSLTSTQGNAQPAGATSEAGRTEHSPTRSASAKLTDSAAAPPQWLADRMSDPQHGAEARKLWNSSRAAHQEASAFREVFAKPEDARAAAQRARLLDDIDGAYFTGDATQRASLAASLLREDPAAFREMVFAGLRALEQADQSTAAANQSTPASRAAASSSAPQTSEVGTQHAASLLGNSSDASPTSVTGHDPQLAAYSVFERSANEDLERTVGGAIDRTLDQALPPSLPGHGDTARARVPALRERLAGTIRQDIERALQGDRQLGEQVAQILSARRFDNEARASVVRLIGERAQQLVPGAARRVLSEWTQTTLAAHRSQRGRTEAATSRREVEPVHSAGGPANTSSTVQANSSATPRAAATAASSQRSSQQRSQYAGPLPQPGSKRGVDYRRLSDEQILDL